jgi:hypothetical protein
VPVFHRLYEGVLVVTVDGDFTVQEAARVGRAGLASPGLAGPMRVLLDLSGTADPGLDRLTAIVDVFAAKDVDVAKLAVQGASKVGSRVVDAASSSGLHSAAFTTKSEAMDWLLRP